MVRPLLLAWALLYSSTRLLAAEAEGLAEPAVGDQEKLSESDRQEALAFTQKELQQKFQSGIGLNLGMIMPWSHVGSSFLWRPFSHISSFSLGLGNFEYSGNLDQRNYLVSGRAQSTYFASRIFVLGFGPVYLEPLWGLVRWNGTIKPRGSDTLADIAASSLSSKFDAIGLDFGVNAGLMWIFTNGMFVDFNFLSLSKAILLKETYTTSTGDARHAIRKQIAGPISMSSVNLRIGYGFDF